MSSIETVKEPTWGTSLEADFEKNTWTFEMVGTEYRVSAGAYALIRDDEWTAIMRHLDRYRRAEAIIREISKACDGDADLLPKLREAVFSFFDPRPL